MKDDLKKIKNGRQPKFFLLNGRQPQNKNERQPVK